MSVGTEDNEYANKNTQIRGGTKPCTYNFFSATFSLKNNLNNDRRLKIITHLSYFILRIIALTLQFYVFSLLHQAIGELEASMKSNLLEAKAMLPDVFEKAKFNSDDLFVILEGVTGFFSGVMGKDPFAALGSALGVIGHFAGKCDLGKLQNNLDKVEKWLKFGQDYAALKDSSELDFDQMDVEAVPEVMQVNIEMLHLRYLCLCFLIACCFVVCLFIY